MSECKSCGAPIVWALTEAGKKVPLDVKSEKRFILKDKVSVEVILRNTYVSHFATCPNADKHRKKSSD